MTGLENAFIGSSSEKSGFAEKNLFQKEEDEEVLIPGIHIPDTNPTRNPICIRTADHTDLWPLACQIRAIL